jgi:hypothetical protein
MEHLSELRTDNPTFFIISSSSSPLIAITLLVAVILSYPLKTFITSTCCHWLEHAGRRLATIMTTEEDALAKPQFTCFLELGEDLMANIFSFVADVPFENPASSFKSTLTHVLPLVSKDVRRITATDFFWKSALDRLAVKDPYLWRKGLESFLPQDTPLSESSLAQQVSVHLDTTSFLHIFQRLTSEYLRFTAPIFHMQGQVRIGHAFGLHFFEPRYRLLIRTVMEGHTANGEPMVEGPMFIYAHTAPLAPTSVACVVQVQQCFIYEDGSADVTLVPTRYVWLERVRELPSTGRLYQGRCLRMGGVATRRMEEEEEVDVMQFMLRHGGLDISTRAGAMHAILRYLRTGNGEALVVVDGDGDGNDDDDHDDDDDNGGDVNEGEDVEE